MEQGSFISGISVMGILLCGNIWFIRRLVIKIDKIDSMVTARFPVQQHEIKNMTDKIESLEGEIRILAKDIKDFGSLRERVAVVEALMKKRDQRGRSNGA
jgi:hypothetical protein